MTNIDVNRSLNTIVKYLLYLNIIYLSSLLFYSSKKLLISVICINIFGLLLYRIFVKYEGMVIPNMSSNKYARKVDKFAGRF